RRRRGGERRLLAVFLELAREGVEPAIEAALGRAPPAPGEPQSGDRHRHDRQPHRSRRHGSDDTNGGTAGAQARPRQRTRAGGAADGAALTQWAVKTTAADPCPPPLIVIAAGAAPERGRDLALLLAVHAGDLRLAGVGGDRESDGALAVAALALHHAGVGAAHRVLVLAHLEAGALELPLVEGEDLGRRVGRGQAERAALLRRILGRVDALR